MTADMTGQPVNPPDDAQPLTAADPPEETPEELARGLVEDVRRLEESN